MTLRLDLLRHGETELGGGLRGSLDDALTAKGWAQMRAAVNSGQKNSHTDTSKLNGVFCKTRSWGLRPYASCIHSKRLTTPAW